MEWDCLASCPISDDACLCDKSNDYESICLYWHVLLLRDHLLRSDEWTLISAGAALTFALTPFWPSGMLSTLGMPLALWAFLHIRNGRISWREYAVFTLLPLYSSIVLGMFFFLFAMGVLWIIDVIKRKKHVIGFLIALIYMSLVYMIVEYRLSLFIYF